MKVTCQSCQARYTIADEKVRGKVAKIRCKKCGTTIVVDGTDGASPSGRAPSSSRGADTSAGGDGWKVIGSDGTERALTATQIAEGHAKGEISDDASVWKEGMADWQPLSQVEALKAALRPGPTSLSPASIALSGPNASPAEIQVESRAPAPAVPERIRAPEPVALRRPGRGASTDLFGAASRHEDGMTSAAPPLPHASSDASAEKLTGARNENSVLFSLSALTGQPSNASAPPTDIAPSSRGADLRSLISTSTAPGTKDGSRLDDIMNLGGGGLYSPALIAPALAPPPLEFSASTDDSARRPKGKGRLAAILGAVVILGGGAVAFTALNGAKETPKTAASANLSATSTAPTSEPTAAVGTAETPPIANPSGNSAVASATAPAHGTAAAETPPAAPTVLAPGQMAPKVEPAWKPPPPKAEPPKTVAVAAPVEKVEKPSAPTPPPAAAPAAAAGGGSGVFDRAAAMSTLSATASAAQACKKPDGPTGSGRVAVTYASNGNATTAEIEGPPFAGTSVGGCVAARFRATRVPPFGGSPMTVHKTFNIN